MGAAGVLLATSPALAGAGHALRDYFSGYDAGPPQDDVAGDSDPLGVAPRSAAPSPAIRRSAEEATVAGRAPDPRLILASSTLSLGPDGPAAATGALGAAEASVEDLMGTIDDAPSSGPAATDANIHVGAASSGGGGSSWSPSGWAGAALSSPAGGRARGAAPGPSDGPSLTTNPTTDLGVDPAAVTAVVAAPAPEPDAWALMLAGFVGLGAMLRTRRARLAA